MKLLSFLLGAGHVIARGDFQGSSTTQSARSDFRSFRRAPQAGTSAQQTLSLNGTPTTGTFRLTYGGVSTAALGILPTAAQVQAALRALPGIGVDGVNVAGPDGGPLVITFAGNLEQLAVPLISVTACTLADNSTQPGSPVTPTIANTVPGVTADVRGIPTNGVVRDVTTGHVWKNTGTPTAPVWSDLGILL